MIRLLPVLALLLATTALTANAQYSQRQSIVVEAENIDWLPFDEALATARAQDKKIMIDVYAPWCGFCRRMHAETYSDESVSNYLSDNYIATRIDGDSDKQYSFMGHTFSGRELAAQLGAQGFPTTVFLYPTGQYLTPLPGFVERGRFLPVLRYISTDAFETTSFEDFARNQ